MRSRVRNRNRDRGGEPIRLASAVGDSPPKRPGYGVSMEKDYLTLKRPPASRPSGEWSDDDFDVLANGEVVGRIFKTGVFVARPWMWTLDIGHPPQPDTRLRCNARLRDGSIRQELAAGMKESPGCAGA
jgi:hypothetical protein